MCLQDPGGAHLVRWQVTEEKKKRKRKKTRQSAIHEETRRICECRRDVGMHCQWKKVGLHEGVENKVGKTLLAKNEERDGAQPVVLGLQTGAFVVFFLCTEERVARPMPKDCICWEEAQWFWSTMCLQQPYTEGMDTSWRWIHITLLFKFCTAAASGLLVFKLHLLWLPKLLVSHLPSTKFISFFSDSLCRIWSIKVNRQL